MEKLEKGIRKNDNFYVKLKNSTEGITLIALVIIIVVLLILARSKYINAYGK